MNTVRKSLLNKASKVLKETSDVEFKGPVNFGHLKDRLNLIKSIVAMANSGGGIILLGVDDNGNPISGFDADALSEQLKPAEIADQIEKYTKVQFTGFTITRYTKNGREVAAIIVEPAETPIVFAKIGECGTGPDRETIFQQGTIYFRHGAKSEPGTTEDLRNWLNRRLKAERDNWLQQVQKITKAPGSIIAPPGSVVIPPTVRAARDGIPVRVPPEELIDPNIAYPYRHNDVITQINHDLRTRFTSIDLYAIRAVYGIDNKPRYFFRPMKGSPQYSFDFVDWIKEQYKKDPEFFNRTRSEYYRQRKMKNI